MSAKRLGAFIFLAVLVFASSAQAQVYQWEDEEGTIQMADDLQKVPERYRERAREIPLPQETEESPPPPALPDESTADPSMEEVDHRGRDRAWWHAQMEKWRRKRAEAEQKLADAEGRLGQILRVNPTVALMQEAAAVREKIARLQEEVQEAERMLNEALPEEARKAAVPPGWLRE